MSSTDYSSIHPSPDILDMPLKWMDKSFYKRKHIYRFLNGLMKVQEVCMGDLDSFSIF